MARLSCYDLTFQLFPGSWTLVVKQPVCLLFWQLQKPLLTGTRKCLARWSKLSFDSTTHFTSPQQSWWLYIERVNQIETARESSMHLTIHNPSRPDGVISLMGLNQTRRISCLLLSQTPTTPSWRTCTSSAHCQASRWDSTSYLHVAPEALPGSLVGCMVLESGEIAEGSSSQNARTRSSFAMSWRGAHGGIISRVPRMAITSMCAMSHPLPAPNWLVRRERTATSSCGASKKKNLLKNMPRYHTTCSGGVP